MRALVIAALAASLLFSREAPAQDLIPERRAVLVDNVDFPGGDLRALYDIGFDACRTACLSDKACAAFTYNRRASACFPKSGPGEPAPYSGAISGHVLNTAPGSLDRARIRAAELDFLQPDDLRAAYDQADNLAAAHVTGAMSEEDWRASVEAARRNGNTVAAASRLGAALNISDAADQWADYAELQLDLRDHPDDKVRQNPREAASAAINTYLRTDDAGLRASALVTLARAMEKINRGRDMIPALRLAQSVQTRDDTAAMLEDAIGKYGFRISETQVEADGTSPRICAVFSEDLVRSGADYAPFVKLPEAGLSVEASGRQICVAGFAHGTRPTLTFREGLPAASGEVLARDTAITQYIRDRSPAVRFPGRAYVLPRVGSKGIPVETVNADTLDLTLLRLSDRNLIRTIQSSYFGRPLDYWSAENLKSEIAEEVWTGAGAVGMEVNRDMTTLLPLDGVMSDLGPGIYALQAAIPGEDPYDNPAATQWFVISDLGLTAMEGVDGLHVFVRALSDASAAGGVTATLLSRANALIGTATTNAEGYAQFAAGLTAGAGGAAPALVMVEKGEDMAFLPLSEAEFDLSDRGVAGREAAPPIDVFMSTDRGAYRAGETVNATLLARDQKVGGLAGLPMTARLIRPDGVQYSRALLDHSGAGGFVANMPLAGSAPHGTWRIESFVEEGKVLASQSFLVEDFLPERIDFDLTLPAGALRLTDRPPLTVAARYLFGAPGAGLDVEGDLRLTALTRLDAFPGYAFGRYDDPFSPYRDALADAPKTDDDGKALLSVSFPDLGEAANRPLEASIAVRVKEGSGRPVERSIERRILPDDPVIGIKALFDGGTVPQGSDARFDLIAVGPDEQAATRSVAWTINRIERNYQWYSLYGNWNWEVTTTRSRVASGETVLTPDGPAGIAAPVDWGSYELVVEAADGAHTASSVEFYAGWYVPADASETPDTLTVALDKDAYRPGDTAQVRIEPRADGVALVTVLSNRLIDMKAVPVTAGENVIELPVTDDWGAGAYVTATVIRPLAADAGRTPARALGLSYAAVDPGARKLSAAFEVAPEADPRGPLPVALKVDAPEGAEVFATIAAVDLGILNLTAFKSPDPEGHYFGQQKLGVGIRDLYGRLIDGQTGTMGAVRSGGDAAAGMKMQSPPPTEELVAYFSGPLTVGADGYARTEFQLPSFNGTVRLMAVIWSDKAVGQAETDVLVRDPVVVTASVPRFLAPGDTARMLLEIVHAAGPAGRMGLDVTGGGLILGDTPSGLDLADRAKAVITVPVTAPDSAGLGTIRVALTTPDGKQLVKDLTIPVQANDPETARQTRFNLAAGQSFTLDGNVFADLLPGSGRATLAAGPIARFNAPGLLASLDRYPYGCTEQLTSKALPLLYFEQVASAMGRAPADSIRKRVEESISEILINQSSNGSFGLWHPDSGDLWLDAYVTDFLSRAKGQGYGIPDTAFRNALDNLRNQINYAPDFDAGGGAYAYALMVLAREGAAAMGDLRYYADVKADAFDTPIASAQLGAALASYGDQRRADRMFAQAADQLSRRGFGESRIWRADYGTNLRDATALLTLAAEAGSQMVDADTLGNDVAAVMAGQRLSTQEATWALLATNALIDRPGAEGFTVNGAAVDGAIVRVLDADAATSQVITNSTARDATVTLTTFGIPTEPEPAGGKGYAIARSYYTLDGTPADIATVKQGTRLVAVIEVTPHDDSEARLMVNDPLPAGFEIDNPSLLRAGDIAALDWLETAETRMTEFRQERFLAAVDWGSDRSFRLAYILRAISPGTFRHPAASVEDMYRPDFRARTAVGQVTVTE